MAADHSTRHADLPATKPCGKCCRMKPLEKFDRDRNRPDGRCVECRDCRRLRYRRKRDQYRETPPRPAYAEKKCFRCREVLPVSQFNRSPVGRDGLTPYCKACNAAYCKRRYAEQKDDPAARERRRAYSRAGHRMRRHGVSPAAYEAMHQAQGGLCAICEQPETARRRSQGADTRDLCVDHCHRTGVIRSLLCSLCNSGLGAYRENPDLLRAAIAYLERHAAAC